jgi:hypothetical protein
MAVNRGGFGSLTSKPEVGVSLDTFPLIPTPAIHPGHPNPISLYTRGDRTPGQITFSRTHKILPLLFNELARVLGPNPGPNIL